MTASAAANKRLGCATVRTAGTNAAAEFYAYNAASGARIATFPLPAITSSRASVDGRSLYIGYGIFGSTGGVRAYILP